MRFILPTIFLAIGVSWLTTLDFDPPDIPPDPPGFWAATVGTPADDSRDNGALFVASPTTREVKPGRTRTSLPSTTRPVSATLPHLESELE